jgi:hypothetical protein
MDDHDERIRQRAHDIWEEEGRPEGREYSHWLRARAEIQEEDGEAIGLAQRRDQPSGRAMERTSKADIALNALPPGTVPENPTAENPERIVRLKPGQVKKPLDARDIDAQLDEPF